MPSLSQGSRHSFRLPIALLLAMIPALASAADLRGTVTDESGHPIAGARALISTAGVRQGSSPLCPSCYPDCGKAAITDAEGRFTIADVDDGLLFNVLIAANGFTPACTEWTDPRKGAASITLKIPPPENGALRGKILDPEGRPVFGAKVEPVWTEIPGGKQFGDSPADPVAVSDRDGLFALGFPPGKVTGLGIQIEAPQLARKIFPARADGTVAEYRLDRGVTVTGRLVRDGKPVPHAAVVIDQANRDAEGFLGKQTIGTDVDGKFELTNVPAGQLWLLSAMRDTLPDDGVTGSTSVFTIKPDTEIDLGDIAVEKGMIIEGRVKLDDGKPIPPRTQVLIDRENAWDPQLRTLDAEGRFRFAAQPGDDISFSVSLPGYSDTIDEGRKWPEDQRLRVNKQTATMEVILHRKGSTSNVGKNITGIVHTPNGKPAEGADVLFILPGQRADIQDGKVNEYGFPVLRTKTDAQGHFALQIQAPENLPACKLLAIHESGWAVESGAARSELTLSPWVRIEGNARCGGAPLVGKKVQAFFPILANEDPAISISATATTDAQGDFQIDRAIPGTTILGALRERKGIWEKTYHSIAITVPAEGTAHVTLGGSGAAVRGRVLIPEDQRARIDFADSIGRLSISNVASTKDFAKYSNYEFEIAPDGSFEIPDVAAGVYSLNVDLAGDSPSREHPFTISIGRAYAQVTVPKDTAVVTLADIPSELVERTLGAGDRLPDFQITSVSGKKISAEDFRQRPGVIIFPAGKNQGGNIVQAISTLPEASRPVVVRVWDETPSPDRPSPAVEEISEVEAMSLRSALRQWVRPSYVVISPEGVILTTTHDPEVALQSLGKVLAETSPR